jgi:ribonuclease HI
VEEIASAPMLPCPITMPKIMQAKNIGHWGTERWDNLQTNAWFTDGSPMLQGGKLHWKSAAWRPTDGQILTGQGMGRSVQHAEVHTARLAIEQSHKEGCQIVRIYSDLWCVCNDIGVWLGKWKYTNWQINGKDIWSKEEWIKMNELSQSISIYMTHVDVHTGRGDPASQHNEKADKLAALMITRNIPWQVRVHRPFCDCILERKWQICGMCLNKKDWKWPLKRGPRSRIIQD